MKKITFYLMTLLLYSSTFAQNSNYLIGINRIKIPGLNNSPLPIPQDYFGQPIGLPNQDPTIGYIGQLPTNASNIQMNSDGESFFKTIKYECLNRYKFQSYNQLWNCIQDYIIWYNTKRLHSSLNYFTPLEMEMKLKGLINNKAA